MSRTPVTQPSPSDHEFFQSGDSGDINDPPSNSLIDGGYHNGDIPFGKDFNWFLREAERLKRFYIQRGLPNWSADETYQVGDVVRYGNQFLVCVVAPPLATNPLTNFDLADRYWEEWFRSPFGTDSSATDTSRIYRAHNNQSYQGNGFDRLGFRDGPRVQNWEENWRGNEQLNATGVLGDTHIVWNATIAGTLVGVTVTDPGSTLHSRVANLQISTGGSDECCLVSDPLSTFDDSLDAAVEGEFRTGANVDLQRISIGLANAGAEVYGATNAFIGGVLYKGNSDTNFKLVTGDGSTLGTPVDSGVAVAANTIYSYRIEWIGSSQAPSGGPTRYMNFFINGTRVAQISTHLPNGGGSPTMSLVIAQRRDTGASARGLTAMPLRFSARTF